MAVPPFPSQALAKLVLGYLAEEQLMTAYDEFLQASPYLDALENEYDRVLMTSLRCMLAEYRAVKIYVETCKPVVLRRMLFQCPNLLEIVKFLIENIDVNKIMARDSTNPSVLKQNSRVSKRFCETCNAHSIQNCVCNRKSNEFSQNQETTQLKYSVETTSLKDLPGHQRQLDKDFSESNQSVRNSKDLSKRVSYNVTGSNLGLIDHNIAEKVQFQDDQNKIITNLHKQLANPEQDFRPNNMGIEKQMSKPATFQEFSTGICGPDKISAPDSSTSENVQLAATKEINSLQSIAINSSKDATEKVKTHYLLIDKNQMGTLNRFDHDNINKATPSINKGIEHKITILSDVKVDKAPGPNNKSKMPQILKNATSTPIMQMQTIFVNGIPAYRQDQTMQPHGNFTKDEIMAMPTIIVAPSANGPKVPSASASLPTTTVSETHKSLGPLVIDLNNIDSKFPNMPTTDEPISNQQVGLVKTVDINKKNPSVPKDNVITSPTKMKTPQVLPQIRKSSSTPRRSTHVRVLDFATPRRILHENANEYKAEGTSEVILSRSPNLSVSDLNSVDKSAQKSNPNVQGGSCKENAKVNPVSTKKKSDWDADLRALALATSVSDGDKKKQTQSKPKSTKKKSTTEKKSRKSEPKSRRKSAKAVKSADGAIVEIIDDDEPIKEDKALITPENVPKVKDAVKTTKKLKPVKAVHTIKPTINIISRDDKNAMLPPESSNKKDKSVEEIKKKDGYNDDLAETPEAERLSLQNVIGAKLNISDFLETPYKQALYDIQMETPRFLGPDIPGDPLSDIKIMNIPTPRFLTSPNPQATPSSYSSRPTDYSSGGSYYKPDDQDYIPSAELLGYPSDAQKSLKESEKTQDKSQDKLQEKPEKSRPVRKCTKNVSYYAGKLKESEDSEINLTTSERNNTKKTPSDDKAFKQTSRTSKEKPPEKPSNRKSETSKESASKKRKSPVKKDKSFMKIKPKKCSPLKCPRSKRKTFTSPVKSPVKKKLPSKDKEVADTPQTITAAPPKSRRKSSTPRKLDSTKKFTSESSGHDSPEMESRNLQAPTLDSVVNAALDSDTEHMALRWSDDCSQDAKSKIDQTNETEDIRKIQEFIATTIPEEGKLQLDLINRGFDAETAKRIEKDLLDTPEAGVIEQSNDVKVTANEGSTSKSSESEVNRESECSNNLLIDSKDEEGEVEEIELSVHECCEESNNYIHIEYNEENESQIKEVHTFKDTFSMEICLDDDLTVRLRSTPLTILVDQSEDLNYRETQMAVSSITNFERLYTPLKDAVRTKCCEIFDSTLTSLDTPLKGPSPNRYHDRTIADIVLEVEKVEVSEIEVVREKVVEEEVEMARESVKLKEKVDVKHKGENKEKPESKKRKRAQSGVCSDDSTSGSKKPKPETQYLLNSANIQNIDIESVLKQLHGI